MASRGRPVSRHYDKNLVKTANERLRKLESVHAEFHSLKKAGITRKYDFSAMSSAYRTVKHYAEEMPEGLGKIYRIDEETGAIRFIGKRAYEALTPEEQRYFERTLNQFLEDPTSRKMGVEEAYQQAYKTFKKEHKQYRRMSFEEYMDTWKTYQDIVKADEDNHFSYEKVQVLINNGQFNVKALETLSESAVEKTNHYMNNVASQTTKGKGGKFRQLHYTNPNGTIADNAPRRPNRYL